MAVSYFLSLCPVSIQGSLSTTKIGSGIKPILKVVSLNFTERPSLLRPLHKAQQNLAPQQWPDVVEQI